MQAKERDGSRRLRLRPQLEVIRVTRLSPTWHPQSHPSSCRWNKPNYWPICLEITRKIQKIFVHSKHMIVNAALSSLRQSVEILPGEINGWVPESAPTYPFLFAERNLGVPQKVLYKAYMVATRAYFGLRSESRKSLPTLQQSNTLDRLTRVVLLANPAHQTALNSRKKLVQSKVVDPHWELNFSGSLLSCRECAKESILWHHRRWLLRVIHENPPTAGADGISEAVPPDVLETELACASTACHLYPRNYHAWTHRRFCVKALVTSLHSEVSEDSSAIDKEYQRTLEWIESHISDYSAIYHAISIEKMLPCGKPTAGRLPTKDHATSLIQSYPGYESLWMYLRGSVTLEDEKELLMLMNETPSARKFVPRHSMWRKVSVSFFAAPIASTT